MIDDKIKIEMGTLDAFQAACHFERAAKLLGKQPRKDFVANVPIIVNCAFAIEVYFKCLYMLENKRYYPKKTHCLQKLYKNLKPDSQTEIKKFYDQRFEEPEGARVSFDLVLSWANTAFEDWRYSYFERWKGPLKALTFANGEELCEAVRERIIQLKPNWKKYLPND